MTRDREEVLDDYKQCCRNLCGNFRHGPRAGCELLDRPCNLKRKLTRGWQCPIGFHASGSLNLAAVDDTTQHPSIDQLVAVTSISPRRIDHQAKSIATWRRIGLSVVAVQGHHDANVDIPGVQFRTVDTGGRAPTITQLLDVAIRIDTPILLINSDIEIYGDHSQFRNQWAAAESGVMGFRWNYLSHPKYASVERYGIDAFRITPDMADLIPDMGLRIGQPVWDWWLPWQLTQLGFDFTAARGAELFHQRHELNWTRADSQAAMRLVDVDADTLTKFVMRAPRGV